MKKLPILLCLVLLLSGCSEKPSDPKTETTGTAVQVPVQLPERNGGDMFTDRDQRDSYDASAAVRIEMNDTSATATSNTVKLEGSVLTITQEATYILTGSFRGTVVVDAPEDAKLQLVLQDAHITADQDAALYIKEADKVFVTLSGENSLENGGSFAAALDEGADGALFSRQDLTLNGEGSLSVTSPAGHGIVCKDDLVITGGSYTVTAAAHGLDANDSIRIAKGALQITAGKDGLHAENSDDATLGFVYIADGQFHITAEGDGISAGADAQLVDGQYHILAGGGSENGTKASSGGYGGFPGGFGGRPGSMPPQSSQSETDATSMKGIKAAKIVISGGKYEIDAADDGIHANGSATVSGGSFAIATGDDGIHAEDTLTVTDGVIGISESYEGLEALHLVIAGGDISLVASDDGLNAAGGTDSSGFGGRDGQFGGNPGGQVTNTSSRPGRPGGNYGGGNPGGGGFPGGFGGFGGNSDGSILISGGKLYIQASGDGIDANGTLEITGGYTIANGPTQGDTSVLDYDVSATVTGGTYIATGAVGMSHGLTQCDQGLIYQRISGTAGSQITLTDASGNVLISHTPALNFQLLILTCPEMVKGQTYTLTIGTATQTITAS